MYRQKGFEAQGFYQERIYESQEEYRDDRREMEQAGWSMASNTDLRAYPVWVTWNLRSETR